MARTVTITERELLALREAATALKDLTESLIRLTENTKSGVKINNDIFRRSLISKSRKKFNA